MQIQNLVISIPQCGIFYAEEGNMHAWIVAVDQIIDSNNNVETMILIVIAATEQRARELTEPGLDKTHGIISAIQPLTSLLGALIEPPPAKETSKFVYL